MVSHNALQSHIEIKSSKDKYYEFQSVCDASDNNKKRFLTITAGSCDFKISNKDLVIMVLT